MGYHHHHSTDGAKLNHSLFVRPSSLVRSYTLSGSAELQKKLPTASRADSVVRFSASSALLVILSRYSILLALSERNPTGHNHGSASRTFRMGL